MKEATKRSIFRWIHLVLSLPILGYIYSPFDKIPQYAFRTRFVFRSWNGAFRIMDVERPRRSAASFEEIGGCHNSVRECVMYHTLRRSIASVQVAGVRRR